MLLLSNEDVQELFTMSMGIEGASSEESFRSIGFAGRDELT